MPYERTKSKVRRKYNKKVIREPSLYIISSIKNNIMYVYQRENNIAGNRC